MSAKPTKQIVKIKQTAITVTLNLKLLKLNLHIGVPDILHVIDGWEVRFIGCKHT